MIIGAPDKFKATLSRAELEVSPIDRVYALTGVQPDVAVCQTEAHAVQQILAMRLAAADANRGWPL